jgi:hypothetical protein
VTLPEYSTTYSVEFLTRIPSAITVYPSGLSDQERLLSLGPLYFDIVIGGSTIANVTVGNVVEEPYIIDLSGSSPNSDLPGIAENADNLVINGAFMSSVTKVELSPVGTCRILFSPTP